MDNIEQLGDLKFFRELFERFIGKSVIVLLNGSHSVSGTLEEYTGYLVRISTGGDYENVYFPIDQVVGIYMTTSVKINR